MDLQKLQEIILNKIKSEVSDLGAKPFYVPEKNLSRSNGILFLGLNPGGGKKDNEAKNTEIKISSFHDEIWGDNQRGEAPLQVQVRRLFAALFSQQRCKKFDIDYIKAEGEADYLNFIGGIVAGNISPFRSPSWKESPFPRYILLDALKAGYWPEIISKYQLKPKLVVTMGKDAFDLAVELFLKAGTYEVVSTDSGWGNANIYRAHNKSLPCTIFGLPHLSRYSLFSNEKSLEILKKEFSFLFP